MPDTTNGKDIKEECNLDSMTSLKNISIRLTNKRVRVLDKAVSCAMPQVCGLPDIYGALRIRSPSEQLLCYQIHASKGKLF